MKKFSLSLFLIFFLFASGCEVFIPPRALPPEVSVEEVVQMAKSSVPPQTIIAKIDASQTVYHLTSQDVIKLKEQGVSYEVIDFMLATEKRDIAAYEQARWRSYYYRYYHDPWWYPD